MATRDCGVCMVWVGEEMARAFVCPNTTWEASQDVGTRQGQRGGVGGVVGWDPPFVLVPGPTNTRGVPGSPSYHFVLFISSVFLCLKFVTCCFSDPRTPN